ncbi:MAG: tRNA guanosine(34) transglycosylase Tgt [Puniceicoccales bacterium]|jgi:queuine tRNA-ribosyltransferase|nr:tRNA guanosine(34) transglycosylase Tgt [Puniceicoccales bacterium]
METVAENLSGASEERVVSTVTKSHRPSHPFSFEIFRNDPSGARLGRLRTPHGSIDTPAFLFCATKASIKGLTAEQVRRSGTQIILANTYHLSLQPGGETVEALGGLHSMMDWTGPLLTDSGGFQIFSLGHGGVAQEIKSRRGSGEGRRTLLKVTEEGALFRSYVDGALHMLTPESSISIQRRLGADIILPLDECTPFHMDRSHTADSTRRSHRWERRSLEEFRRHGGEKQVLYGIIQGGIYEDLRRESCAFVAEEDFFGQAIGGSLGGEKSQMREIVDAVGRMKHPTRPTHLLGIGGVEDIFRGICSGVDTFDCVHPTRLARHGGALLPFSLSEGKGHINLRSGRFATDRDPVDPTCDCLCCGTVSRGYVHHLLKAGETLGGQLLTLHNIAFLNRLMVRIRSAIATQSLDSVKDLYLR